MTEAEWLAATDPTPMLQYLRGKTSDRKLRLVAVASCYRIWDCFADERSRAAIETAERFADGRASSGTLVAVRQEAESVPRWRTTRPANSDLRPWGEWASETALSCSAMDAYPPHDRPAAQHNYFTTTPASAANVVAARRLRDLEADRLSRGEDGVSQGDDWSEPLWDSLRMAEYREQAILFRDIFGNPFRRVTFDPVWRTTTAIQLAQQMYDSRNFSAMPILADALEDARCDHADILDHCRGNSPHVRGCWVVDLVLGKS